MILKAFDPILTLHREDKKLFARLHVPHRVISTCRVNGGLREDITAVMNHQSCEPCKHLTAHAKEITRFPGAYQEKLCSSVDIDYTTCAVLGTAANMNDAAVCLEEFRDLKVLAVTTGGVEGNAGRAGDPAWYLETETGFEDTRGDPLAPKTGTINSMIFINQALTPAALTRSIVTATEAKSAALQELAVNSRYSMEPATGTGTDQIAVASPLTDGFELTSSGKHTKLGELIGRAVKASVKQTLSLQNTMTPEAQRSVKIHLERFGTGKADLMDRISSHLGEDRAELLKNNPESILKDPLVTAAVAALAHLWDKIHWGILPQSCTPEIWCAHGAQAAAAVSGLPARIPYYQEDLSNHLGERSAEDFINLICRALALGYEDKWKS